MSMAYLKLCVMFPHKCFNIASQTSGCMKKLNNAEWTEAALSIKEDKTKTVTYMEGKK